MKRAVRWASIILGIGLCGLTIIGFLWVRQYLALTDADPEIVLAPSIADITYCTMDGVPLQMDLYFPEDSAQPAPLLLYFHGGSFTGGDKRQGSGIIDIPAMTGRGYAVAAVNYRLMPEHPFPAAVEDAKCAIRYLRANAGEYHLRVDKIGVWGGSAGGQVVAMVGLTGGEPEFEVGTNLDQSSAVDAVVDMFGPADLTMPMGWLQRLLLRRAFGTDASGSGLLERASPVRYVKPGVPPFLIMHGEQDSAVPFEQAQALYQKLIDAGNTATLVEVKNANHNFKPTGGPIEPNRQEISTMMADFFDRWIKP